MNEIEVLRLHRPDVPSSADARSVAWNRLHDSMQGAPSSKSRRRVVLTMIGAVIGAALIVVSPSLLGSGPPEAVAGFSFPDGTTITQEEMLEYGERGDWSGLRESLAEYGVALHIDEKLVAPRAAGRIYSISYAPEAQFTEDNHLMVSDELRGSTISIQVGRPPHPGEKVDENAGLHIYETHPHICEATDPLDPVATHAALTELGFEIKWTLLLGERPPFQERSSSTPPAEGKIISIVDRRGAAYGLASDLTELWIEVIPPEATWHEPVGC
jgi:hypothetical protein